MAETAVETTPTGTRTPTGTPASACAPAGETIPTEVSFRGERSGTAPLTWGQRAIWHAIRRTAPNDHYFNIGRVLPLADRGRPATVAATLDALARLIERHEALRTRLVPAAAGGEPAQCLTDTGTLPVTIAPATGLPEAAAEAEALLGRMSATRFDYPAEWPLRAALVTVGDRVTHAVLVLCHLAADGHAAEVLVRDLRLLVRRGSAGRPPATTPLDLARDQHAERGRRRGAAALAHWEAGFRAAPPTMFPEPCAEPRSPRFWTGRIVSPALARAVAAVAAAHGVSGSTVLLTASAALVAAGEGHRTAAVMPIVGNRTAEALRDLVSTLSQDGLFILDLAAAERKHDDGDGAGDGDGAARFTDLLPAAHRAALRAYRAAVYDPVEWDALGERLHTEYGSEVHPYCCFNDMRLVERPVSEGPRPAPQEPAEELTEARRRTAFGFPATQDRVACRYCLHITEEGDALAVSLTADTAYLPPEAIRAHLYAMEELIVTSAAGGPPLVAELRALLETAEGDRP
ncbi:condensation domain-containing protein [Streptomyces sp. TRM75563]|uniref:condensation domain-containing protein n=1 Tax=Streptomyces sp. TRM75563 TaxID=2817418 RepID=UPI001F614837|nr:condensation domain-containing protein [Streptomyces sp. TRM75563]MCI4039670.1 condensation domain-containing protein [Streptomyces sp. TRM75563]